MVLPFAEAVSLEQRNVSALSVPRSDQAFLFLLKVLAMGQDFTSCNMLRK